MVVGGAACWRDDVARLEKMAGGRWPGPIFACNDVATVLPDLDHFCTLHAEKLPQWKRQRLANGLPFHFETWSCANRTPVDHHWDQWTGGSSGLYALAVALFAVGCERAVLCGIPMNADPNAFREEARWHAHARYVRGWKRDMEQLQGRVRSMSGTTMEWFGSPDESFLRLRRAA